MKTIFLLLLAMSQNSLAGSLKEAANKINTEIHSITYIVGAIGILIASIYFMIGHQNASARMSNVMFGLLSASLAGTIVAFMGRLA